MEAAWVWLSDVAFELGRSMRLFWENAGPFPWLGVVAGVFLLVVTCLWWIVSRFQHTENRIGVFGTSQSGKTVFDTMLIHRLLMSQLPENPRGNRLPRNRWGIYWHGDTQDWYKRNYAKIAHNEWPPLTPPDTKAEVSFTVFKERHWLLRPFLGKITRKVESFDVPGEMVQKVADLGDESPVAAWEREFEEARKEKSEDDIKVMERRLEIMRWFVHHLDDCDGYVFIVNGKALFDDDALFREVAAFVGIMQHLGHAGKEHTHKPAVLAFSKVDEEMPMEPRQQVTSDPEAVAVQKLGGAYADIQDVFKNTEWQAVSAVGKARQNPQNHSEFLPEVETHPPAPTYVARPFFSVFGRLERRAILRRYAKWALLIASIVLTAFALRAGTREGPPAEGGPAPGRSRPGQVTPRSGRSGRVGVTAPAGRAPGEGASSSGIGGGGRSPRAPLCRTPGPAARAASKSDGVWSTFLS